MEKVRALVDAISRGIEEKKGKDITIIDLKETDNSVCDFFVICSATSTTQAEAICNSIEDFTEKTLNELPKRVEGKRNAQWILMDYFNVIVHIFLEESRAKYNLERLWADGKIEYIEGINP
ncbi:MAG: ribosome silencing factor [Luteibaculaceae bacterium]